MRRFSLDFTRAIRADESTGWLPEGSLQYHVRVNGQNRPEVTSLRWDEALLQRLETLRSHVDGSLGETAARVGRRLAEFLEVPDWRGPERELAASGDREPAALTLRSNASELYLLPWELLPLDPTRRVYAGSLPELLLRYEWPDTATATRRPGLSQTAPGRIVFGWSAAGGKVDAARHVKLIERSLDSGRAFFDDSRSRALDVIENTSCEALHSHLKRAASRGEPVAVLHLLCHGGCDDEGTFGLVLNSGDDPSAPDLVDPGRLQLLLQRFAGLVRLVVVAACDGGNAGPVGHELGSVAQALHRAGFPAVIASRFPLSWDGARVFAAALYDRMLGELATLEAAFLAAREALSLRDSYDWASLQLYARAADGDATRVFNIRPYRGLAAFRPEHARFFFGRRAESDELVRELDALAMEKKPRFMVVAGASGTGKSSLVLAGVLPLLHARALERREPFEHLVARPGVAPDEVLARVEAKRSALVESVPLLIVVDQFEEVFTHVTDPTVREAFVRALWAWANEPDGAVRVVLTLRIDFLGRCGEIVLDDTTGMRLDRVALDHAQQVLLAQMDPAQLRDAIEGPAAVAGITLEPGLAEEIVRDVGAEPGALPLMAHALYLLWRGREGATLTRAAYEAMGGVQGALDRHAEEQLAALTDDAEREAARRIMVRLVHPGAAGALDSRRRRSVEDLRRASRVEEERFERVLARLVDARLLVSGEADAVELAHEAMLRTWRRLAGWIDEERARLVQLAQVEAWAEEWRRSHDALLAGSRLGYAEEVAVRHREDLSEHALAFIQASRAEQDRQREALLDALSSARDNGRMSALRDTVNDPAAQVALLREVERPERTRRWDQSARWVLASEDVALVVMELGRATPGLWGGAELSPNGSLLLTWFENGDAQIRRTDGAGEPVNVRGGRMSGVTSATFSPSGEHVVVTDGDGWIRVWRSDGASEPVAFSHPSLSVNSASWSPDGGSVVTASHDQTARVWRADGAGEAIVLRGHEKAVTAAVFSPDGTRVLTRSHDATARLFRADGTGAPVVLRGHEDVAMPEALRDGSERTVTAATFSPDGTRVLTAARDCTARVWSADGAGEATVLRGHEKAVTAAVFSPDGTRVLTRSEDGTARLWRAGGGGGHTVLVSEDEVVTSAVFSPDGDFVLTAAADGTARVWRTAEAREPVVLRGHTGALSSVSFSRDATHALTASLDGTARVWRIDGAGRVVVLRGGESPMMFAAFLSDGARVIAVSADGTARVWRAGGACEPVTLQERGARIETAAFSRDGARLLTASDDGVARVWRVDAPDEPPALLRHEPDAISAAFSADAARVFSFTRDGVARVWRADGTGAPFVVQSDAAHGHVVAFSGDGARMLTASAAHRTVSVCRVGDGGEPIVLRGHEKAVRSAMFSPDGTRVLTASFDGTVRVWAANGAGEPVVLRCPEEHIELAVFSPDGACVLTASSQKFSDAWVRVWRADGTGGSTVLRGARRAVKFHGFSRDGACVLGGAEDGSTRVWRADGSAEPIVLPLPPYVVRSAALSPDGANAASAEADGTVRVCRADGAGEPFTLCGRGDVVSHLAFSPDGTRLLTATREGAVRIWGWSRWRSISDMLWSATTYCLPVERRMLLLGEREADAREAVARAKTELARRGAAAGYRA